MGYITRVNHPAILPTITVAVSIGATHNESAAVNCDAVRLVATVDCFVAFGALADSSAMFMPAKVPEVFQFTPGQKVSVIRASRDGVLYVTSRT